MLSVVTGPGSYLNDHGGASLRTEHKWWIRSFRRFPLNDGGFNKLIYAMLASTKDDGG